MAATNGETAGEPATTEPWQAYMKDELEPDSDGIDQEVLATLRALLLAPEGDNQPLAQAAAQRLLDLYHDSYPKEDYGFYLSDDKGACGYLDSISIPVIELATHFRWDSAKHQRLADTMIAVRDGCTEKFIEEDPQLVYNAEGVLMKVDRAWNACSITTFGGLRRCNTNVNMTALFAKLFGAGLFDGDLKYVLFDLTEAFDKSPAAEPLRQGALEACAALWLIYGGSILAQVTKENESGTSKKQFPDVFNKQNWKHWAERLAQIAHDAPDDAEFDLKRLASKAHDRMVEVYPEALEQDK
ncbi:unnamed protein product [Clonostachys rosea]|uniref:Uncharacterized protein n=1 Tax=Bionectria ochroleuca TaxID=29856 RepID=A0ABY6UEG8_BIOOC|nr:unnamed protein product [Clonostachys rosea]